MRFAAVQILAKIGVLSLNGEKLDELHYITLIFGQFAVLHALSPPISSRHNLQGGGRLNLHGLSLCSMQFVTLTVGTHSVRPNGDGAMLPSCASGTHSQ